MHNTNVAVALLYEAQELGRHLREALTSMGTPIVYEAAPADLDLTALENSGARVVVVNLDPEVEAHLDEVYGLLEDDRYCVVFNDAQASSSLSGWDQARWARHLAAKILGDANIDPPRPEGAEAIPAPVARAESTSEPETETIEMTSEPEAIEIASEPDASYDTRLQSIVESTAEEPAAATAGDPLDMLESRYEEMSQPATAAYPSPPPPPADAFDFSTLEALTAAPAPPSTASSTGLDLAEELFEEPPARVTTEPAMAFDTEPGEESITIDPLPVSDEPTTESSIAPEDLEVFDLDALDKLLDEPQPSGNESIDVGDLGDFGPVEPVEIEERATAAAPPPPASPSGLSLADDVAFEAPSAPKTEPSPASMLKLAAAADWSLEDMLQGDAPPVPAPTGRADFGIEKMSAAEYLAPSTENTAPPPMPEDDGLSLELMPIEEAVAPQQHQREMHEAWLDPDKVVVPAKIRRVWVLGASIGGPEAVRDFLAELPRDYPALFLLAQHMGAEFVDLMAQQLAKSTPLTVRTPTHGERVAHGDVVVVPTTHRLQVDPDGTVVLERTTTDGAYSPSIDRVLRDVADRYGANAGAIVFSGMTTDSVEGAKYLASKGGTIFAQHPDTCVVSSMIDGVVEAGVVKYLAAPKELAEMLLADQPKKR
ncbi:MAG TPA: chemotaxis protein CheB [Rhodanobacteraceae bacterium]|nr:chemotaxis protein CheB [Rhodanobacteraceae bacterium]